MARREEDKSSITSCHRSRATSSSNATTFHDSLEDAGPDGGVSNYYIARGASLHDIILKQSLFA